MPQGAFCQGHLCTLLAFILFLAVLDLCCFVDFPSHREQGLLSRCSPRASLVEEHGLWGFRSGSLRALEHRLNTWAQLLHGMWDLPRPGIESESPAWAGRFFTTEPPGKLAFLLFFKY